MSNPEEPPEPKKNPSAEELVEQRLLQQNKQYAQERFREHLETSGVRSEETFNLDGGFVRIAVSADIVAASLLSVADPDDILEPGREFNLRFTTESLLRATRDLEERYPDIHFDFRDKGPERFSYIVTLTQRFE